MRNPGTEIVSSEARRGPSLSQHASRVGKQFLQAFGLGGGARLKEIHPPPDPSPSTLRGDDREFWEVVRKTAYDYYSQSGAPEPKKVAERSAWKATRGRAGLQNVWKPGRLGATAVVERMETPKPMKLRVTDEVIALGPLLEYVWIDQHTGDLVVSRWKKHEPPVLYWNDAEKELLVFPHADDPTSCMPITEDLEEAAEMFETWMQRPPECVSEIEIPVGKIKPLGLADSLVYVSDKWHAKNPDPAKRGSQEYFHQDSDGTWLFQDPDHPDDPRIIRIHGGMLDVESRGIIH
jgi:hypothetical protein